MIAVMGRKTDSYKKVQTARLARPTYASNWGVMDTLREWLRFLLKLLVVLLLVGGVVGGWWLFRYTHDNAKRLDDVQKQKQQEAAGEAPPKP